MALAKCFRELNVYAKTRSEVREIVLDCGYIDAAMQRRWDGAWQHIGAMLGRMIDQAEQFCRHASR